MTEFAQGKRNQSDYLQDKNAGNAGDLLKHFWLLRLIQKVVTTKQLSKVAYLESHAGAGRYKLDGSRLHAIDRYKKRIHLNAEDWATFDRLNHHIQDGVYLGSFVLALQLLAEWKENQTRRVVRALLWENEFQIRNRIRDCLLELPQGAANVCLDSECSPETFIKNVATLTAQGYTVIWLCDPFWGSSKADDTRWFQLLNGAEGYGILFAYVGGNSRLSGPDKFDYMKGIGAPAPPPFRFDDNIRSYALYCTTSTERILSAGEGT